MIQRRTLQRKRFALDELHREACRELLRRIEARLGKLSGLDLTITVDLLDSILQEVSPRRRDKHEPHAAADEPVEILDAADIIENNGARL